MNNAMQFVKTLHSGWNLGNVFDAADGKPYDAARELSYLTSRKNPPASHALLQCVYDAGFRTLRLPVSWHNHIIDDDYNISKVWLDCYKEAVDNAINIGFYVIVNIHHDDDPAWYFPGSAYLDSSWKFMNAVWSKLSELFKDYDEHLLFESINEPRLRGTEYEWKPIDPANETQMDALHSIMELNQRFVNLIRNSGGNNTKRYLLCPSHAASADNTILPAFDIPKDIPENAGENRIIVSVHAYIPYFFALAPIGDEHAVSVFDPGNKKDTDPIDKFMGGLHDKYTSKGIPLMIGEFGASDRGGNLSDRAAFTKYYVDKARSYGITCVWWDNGSFGGDYENFGIIDRTKCEVVYPEIVKALVGE